MSSRAGPLAGVRVLDLTRLLPGGYASLLLADMGADVVKVEEPGRGDYVRAVPPLAGEHSAAHLALNRGKRSVTLNLKNEAARDIFVRLAGRFDVVLESFRPGVLDRLGCGYQELSRRHPRLVYAAITGYGQDGPRAQEAGHDIDYIAYGGVLAMTGAEHGPPVVPGVQIGDLAGGGMAAVIAVLAALRSRDATGKGAFCDVSMLDGVLSWMGVHAAMQQVLGGEPRRGLMPLTGAYPCYRVYPAADGYVAVGALEPHFWAALCRALGREDLLGDAFATGERRQEVIAELEAIFSSRARADWAAAFDGVDACVAPVCSIEEALADPQLRARGMIVEHGAGPTRALLLPGNPIRVGGSAPRRCSPAPALGEHTAEVLEEIGLGRRDLAALSDEGAL